MDVHAAYLPARRGGVEGLIVYLAYLVAVDSVGKVRAEALKVEQLRPAAYLLVGREGHGDSAVRQDLFHDALARCQDLSYARLVVRAE